MMTTSLTSLNKCETKLSSIKSHSYPELAKNCDKHSNETKTSFVNNLNLCHEEYDNESNDSDFYINRLTNCLLCPFNCIYQMIDCFCHIPTYVCFSPLLCFYYCSFVRIRCK